MRINGNIESGTGGGDPVASSAVTNRNEVLPFFDACRTRRGTILLMADSNHNYNSWGWVKGLGIPLLRRYGCWGFVSPLSYSPMAMAAATVAGFSAAGTATNWPLGALYATAATGTNLLTVPVDIATGRECHIKYVSEACGLTVDNIYYWNRQSATTGYMYDTLANAITGGAAGRVDITGAGATVAGIGFSYTYMTGGSLGSRTTETDLCHGHYIPGFTPSATDQANNVLTFVGAHGFASADEVTVSATGGGLTAGTSYYVKVGDESDANTLFELRLYTDVGLTSIVDITADITAEISAILAVTSRYNTYIGLESTAPGLFVSDALSLRYTLFYRTFATGVNGSLKPACRAPSPFTVVQEAAAASTTVTGSNAWASTSITLTNSAAISTLASATQATITGHPFQTQDPVVLVPGGTNGTQVLQGITYYVRRVDANTIQLHASASNANSNTSALTLTSINGTLERKWLYYEFTGTRYNTTKMAGKMLISTRWLDDPNTTNGLALSEVFGSGGATAQYMLTWASAAAGMLPRYLTELQTITSNGPLLIWIQVGGNDRSGSVAAATVQSNVQAIMDIWKTAWASAGGVASDLYFVLMLNHPQQTIAENLNDAYHTAYDTLAANNSRTANVKIKTLAPAGEMYLQGATVWFDSGGDAHLTAAGYTELGNRVVSAVCG